MSALPIPDEALKSHIAILGKTGSGKSNAAKTVAELEIHRGERVCVVDPTGTWFGLRLDRDGKSASKPGPGGLIVIFGGEHGDLPISAEHGAAIAETIATSSTSAIVDTRQMSVGARTRFFTDFAETLIARNQGELTLIIDEAHLFAPQGRVNDPRSGAMLHAANNLVSLGRGVGLTIVLVTQRPAKLHKDSLTQAETLVAMRLLHNLDIDAVRAWIGEWADPAQGKELVASLPSLKQGEAWVWSPEIGVLKREKFPLVATFDSGKPRAGKPPPKLKAIDVAAIAEKLTKVAADVLANDPKRLKARIAELEKLMRDAAAAAAKAGQTPDPAVLRQAQDAAEEGGYRRGLAELSAAKKAAYGEGLSHAFHEIRSIYEDALQGAAARVGDALAGKVKGWEARAVAERRDLPKSTRAAGDAPAYPVAKIEKGPTKPAQNIPRNIPEGAGDLPPARRKILVALRQLESVGKRAPDKVQVALLAGASPKSSAYTNNLGALRSAGLVDYPAGGVVMLTEAGAALEPAHPSMSHADLLAFVERLLPPAQFRIVQWLVGIYPDEVGKAELAEAIGASPASSAYTNNLGRLRSLGLIDYPRPGVARAAEVLFP